jgi:hypothetical protein
MKKGETAVSAPRRDRCAHAWLSFAGASVVLLHTWLAGAYCRTTSVPTPPNWDPAVLGCWGGLDAGAPSGKVVDLAWRAGSTIPYSIAASASQYVTIADATRVAHLAFDAWNNAKCPGGTPNIQTYDNGPADAAVVTNDCGLNVCAPTVHDGNHLIVFRDSNWPHNDSVNTLALTTVTYGVNSGTIYDADVEINSNQHVISALEPPPPGAYDLQAILTHEAGHFIGFAHATDTSAIMYAFYHTASIDLQPDDLNAVCTVYPPLPPPSSGCSFGPSRTRSGAVAAALCGLLAAVALRMSRRRG